MRNDNYRGFNLPRLGNVLPGHCATAKITAISEVSASTALRQIDSIKHTVSEVPKFVPGIPFCLCCPRNSFTFSALSVITAKESVCNQKHCKRNQYEHRDSNNNRSYNRHACSE